MSIFLKQPIFGVEIEALSAKYKGYSKITSDFNEAFGVKGSITYDFSVKDLDKKARSTFEWRAPPLKYSPETIQKYLDGLSSLFLGDVIYYTNKSCSFHTHISFDDMSKEDMLWIYACLTLDKQFRQSIQKCKNLKFASKKYAGTELMDKLYHNLIRKDLKSFFKNVTNTKNECFRLHPQGTIEWRGPRNFLNRRKESYIREYLAKLKLFIEKLYTYLLLEKTPNGISREHFREALSKREQVTNYSVINFPENKILTRSKRSYRIGQNRKILNEIFRIYPMLSKLSYKDAWLELSNDGGLIWKSGTINKKLSDKLVYREMKFEQRLTF